MHLRRGLIFAPKLSFLKASVIPRIASGGPSFTFANVEALAANLIEIWD